MKAFCADLCILCIDLYIPISHKWNLNKIKKLYFFWYELWFWDFHNLVKNQQMFFLLLKTQNMYKIGNISQKIIFLPLFAYDIIFIEKAGTTKTFLGVFWKIFAKKVLKGQKGVFWYFSTLNFFINLSNIPLNTLRSPGSYCGKNKQGQAKSHNFLPHFFQKGLFKRVKGV